MVLNSKQSQSQMTNKNARIDPKDPMDLYYIRRVTVRHQKRQLILVKLSDFPVNYIYVQLMILIVVTISMIGTQIAIIVHKTQLYFIVPGFWVSFVYIGSILSLIYMMTERSYGSLILTQVLFTTGSIFSLGGIILVNAFDMAMFNSSCMTACEIYSYQYLNLIMLIFGAIGCISFVTFLVLLEIYVLKDSKKLNIYLGNRN